MKNKSFAMATVIGLGLLATTGTAQAVQTKMTITGSLIDITGGGSGTNSTDEGLNSLWGSNLFPNQVKDRITNDDNGKVVTIDLTFDSAIFGNYGTSGAQHSHTYEVLNSPVVSAAISLNSITHQFTSSFRRNFYDKGLTFQNGANVADGSTDIFGVVVTAAEGVGAMPVEILSAELSFANGSTPILQNLSMAKASTFTPISAGNASTRLVYKTGHHSGGAWDYNSTLYFAPTGVSIAPVPEPETWAMLMAGLALVGFAAKRRCK